VGFWKKDERKRNLTYRLRLYWESANDPDMDIHGKEHGDRTHLQSNAVKNGLLTRKWSPAPAQPMFDKLLQIKSRRYADIPQESVSTGDPKKLFLLKGQETTIGMIALWTVGSRPVEIPWGSSCFHQF
jgi:hypothetical protein